MLDTKNAVLSKAKGTAEQDANRLLAREDAKACAERARREEIRDATAAFTCDDLDPNRPPPPEEEEEEEEEEPGLTPEELAVAQQRLRETEFADEATYKYVLPFGDGGMVGLSAVTALVANARAFLELVRPTAAALAAALK